MVLGQKKSIFYKNILIIIKNGYLCNLNVSFFTSPRTIMHISQTVYSDFRQGQIHSFYRDVYPSLLRYAVRFLGSELWYAAEDCVADAIFKAYQNRLSFKGATELKSFVYTCVHNEIVTIFKKNDRHKRYLDRQRTLSEDLMDHVVMQETLDQLQAAVDSLPPRLRAIFELSFEEGLKRREVAERLQLSESTVKRDKSQLIAMLREALADDPLAQLILFTFLQLHGG